MKARTLLIFIVAMTIATAANARTKTLHGKDFHSTLTLRKGGVSTLRFTNLANAYVVYLKMATAEAGTRLISAQRHKIDLYNSYFEMDISTLDRGTYIIYAAACYQDWEMNLVVK